MRVLILANKVPYPPKDGGSIATLQMITGLMEQGHRVTCLAMNTSKHPFPVEEIPGTASRGAEFYSVPCNTSIRPLELIWNLLFSREPYIARRFRIPGFRRLLDQLMEKNEFDLVQMEGPYTAPYIPVLRRYSRAKVALRAHNVEHLIWKLKSEHEPCFWRKWYLRNMAERLRRYELEVIRQCDYLIAISQTDELQFRSLGTSIPVLTIPAGISVQEYTPTPLPAQPDIFFIGALDWLPNQEGLSWFLEKVFPLLLEKLPELVFHIAGRNATPRFLKILKHPQIKYHGEVEDARQYMGAHRVMVAPLLTGSGIRIKILEAMALGRPVVTTPVGIQGIPAVDGREILVTDDPAQFAQHLIRLVTGERAAREQSDRALTLVRERFDTFAIFNRLSQFYATHV